jgi:hypothetical protein
MSTADKQGSSVAYRLAKLLKHIENRQCADCSAALLEWQNFYGSLKFQVWVCNTCYETHEAVLDKSMLMGKRIKDVWSSDEVSIMEKATNARYIHRHTHIHTHTHTYTHTYTHVYTHITLTHTHTHTYTHIHTYIHTLT